MKHFHPRWLIAGVMLGLIIYMAAGCAASMIIPGQELPAMIAALVAMLAATFVYWVVRVRE